MNQYIVVYEGNDRALCIFYTCVAGNVQPSSWLPDIRDVLKVGNYVLGGIIYRCIVDDNNLPGPATKCLQHFEAVVQLSSTVPCTDEHRHRNFARHVCWY